jgi:hypothetical protein
MTYVTLDVSKVIFAASLQMALGNLAKYDTIRCVINRITIQLLAAVEAREAGVFVPGRHQSGNAVRRPQNFLSNFFNQSIDKQTAAVPLEWLLWPC